MKHAVFLSTGHDLHAAAVARALIRQSGGAMTVSIVDMDRQSQTGGFNWSIGARGEAPGAVRVKSNDGGWIALDEADLIWCRRFTRPQRSEGSRGFVSDQWNAAGWSWPRLAPTTWIDAPRHIIDAEQKAVQLQCAFAAGFRVPRTLISQDVDRISAFAAAETDGVIVKPLRGSIDRQIYTIDLTDAAFERPGTFAAFPAIYQQKIRGDRHVRIVCLPNVTATFMITSHELDWRRTRDVSICRIDTDPVVAACCESLLRSLQLTMGVIDAKLQDDELFFLEVNPQGQFLFLEALSGINLRDAYADYFLRAAS